MAGQFPTDRPTGSCRWDFHFILDKVRQVGPIASGREAIQSRMSRLCQATCRWEMRTGRGKLPSFIFA